MSRRKFRLLAPGLALLFLCVAIYTASEGKVASTVFFAFWAGVYTSYSLREYSK